MPLKLNFQRRLLRVGTIKSQVLMHNYDNSKHCLLMLLFFSSDEKSFYTVGALCFCRTHWKSRRLLNQNVWYSWLF